MTGESAATTIWVARIVSLVELGSKLVAGLRRSWKSSTLSKRVAVSVEHVERTPLAAPIWGLTGGAVAGVLCAADHGSSPPTAAGLPAYGGVLPPLPAKRSERSRNLFGCGLASVDLYPESARDALSIQWVYFPLIVCLCDRLRISNIHSANFHRRLYRAR